MNRLTGFAPDNEHELYFRDDDDARAIANHVVGVLERWQRMTLMLHWAYDERCGRSNSRCRVDLGHDESADGCGCLHRAEVSD
jgi:hypothetical protein